MTKDEAFTRMSLANKLAEYSRYYASKELQQRFKELHNERWKEWLRIPYPKKERKR